MKLLILTPQLPYPPQQGTSLRNFHIIRGLAERHKVYLLSFLEDGQRVDPEMVTPLTQLAQLSETIPVPLRTMATRLWQLLTTTLPDMAHRLYSDRFDAALRQLLNHHDFDLVQVEGIELARYMKTIAECAPKVPIVFDDHNAETELQRRNFLTDVQNPKRWLAAAYSWIQVGRLRRFERWACQTAAAVVAVSDMDRTHLQSLFASHERQQVPIYTIPNSIDVEAYQAYETPISFDLVFSGKMDYRPNVDAVLWFAEEIWPLICQKRPSTTWVIVGQKPHARLEILRGTPGISLTGWVEMVQPYLAGALVFVMPFRVGSGTRLKLIEAMAVGKPIVSTTVGAEGFPVAHGKELLFADTVEDMVSAVVQLLEHPEKRAALGKAAQRFANQYDWRQVIPRFEEVYDGIVQ